MSRSLDVLRAFAVSLVVGFHLQLVLFGVDNAWWTFGDHLGHFGASCCFSCTGAPSFSNRWRARRWTLCLLLGLSIPLFAEIERSWLARAAKHVATYSYGIYLVHVPILWWVLVTHSAWPAGLRVLLTGLLLTTVPLVLYHLWEHPFVRLGQSVADLAATRLPATRTDVAADATTDAPV